MTTFYLPFTQRIGGDASNDVHNYDNATIAPYIPSPIGTTTAMSEVESLRAQLAAKDIELGWQRTLNERTEEKYRRATSLYKGAVREGEELKKERDHFKKEWRDLCHEWDEFYVENCELEAELRAERVAHNATRAGYDSVVERLEAAEKANQRHAHDKRTVMERAVALNTENDHLARRIRELEVALAHQTARADHVVKKGAEISNTAGEVVKAALARVATAEEQVANSDALYTVLAEKMDEGIEECQRRLAPHK